MTLNMKNGDQEIDPSGINFLDLGYGRTQYEDEIGEPPPKGMFFVDIDESIGPDIVWDLDKGIPLQDNTIGGTINLGQVIASLQNPQFVAQEIMRIATPGTYLTVGTYISIDDILNNLSAWGLLPTDVPQIKKNFAEEGGEEDPDWVKKTSVFMNTLTQGGAQIVEREFSGVYDVGAHVIFTIQL